MKAHLTAHGFAKTTVQWLLSNLRSVVTPPLTGAPSGEKKMRTLEWRCVCVKHAILVRMNLNSYYPLTDATTLGGAGSSRSSCLAVLAQVLA